MRRRVDGLIGSKDKEAVIRLKKKNKVKGLSG